MGYRGSHNLDFVLRLLDEFSFWNNHNLEIFEIRARKSLSSKGKSLDDVIHTVTVNQIHGH